MNVDSPIALLYHTYNSLFLSLPFSGIAETGTHLALFARDCEDGLRQGRTPDQIIGLFWDDYFEKAPAEQRFELLFRFIQYIERQVVLFDAVEDARFEQLHADTAFSPLSRLLGRLEADDTLREKLLRKLRTFSLRLVLTAHPTQFYPGKVLGILNDLGLTIQGHDLEKIRLLLMQLGKTAFVNREPPTPYSEAVSLGWYLENVFYHALPDILFRLLKALGQSVVHFENPNLLALGFWPGGDRDGNPHVTADVTLLVAQRLRESVLRGYYRDVRLLRRRLTFRGVEERIATVETTLKNTLYPTDPAAPRYDSADQLLADLLAARQILHDDHDDLFLDELDRFILKVRVFGFYFASLDIRQDSRKVAEAWGKIAPKTGAPPDETDEDALLNHLLTVTHRVSEKDFDDPFVQETLLSFRAIGEIQAMNGERGCHRYILSNCGSALDVGRALALARLVSGESNLDVAPLFETVEDLAEAGAVMARLYTNEFYMRHLEARGRVQHIMLGFSDGTKDGGYLRANWSIYRAKEALTRISRAHDVTVVFFDGRGGPPGRGGGNNASYYAAQGQDIENQAIHVTIQGQTVSSTYGTIVAARHNTERLLTAGLESSLFPARNRELLASDRALLDELAEAAYQSYLGLKNHPDFVPYLEKMTPLTGYGDTKIASRPTRRNADEALRFEDLRAIPFVGAWAQMKQNVPSYYGFGEALERLSAQEKNDDLRRLYQHSLFFRTLVENSMQSLSKSSFEVTRYIETHPQFGEFWGMLHREFERTRRALLEVSGQKDLLSDNPESRSSIALREQIVLPLSIIQQFALQQLEKGGLEPGEADIFRRLVLRAMFGIINAARNAA